MNQSIQQWALKWGVSLAALQDLQQQLGTLSHPPAAPDAGTSEAAVQAQLRLTMSKAGGHLWRNNNGAGYLDDRSFVRWGLANDSQKMNERFKSSDLIGIKPVIIRADMVGTSIGQFVAREVKPTGWAYGDTDRERAQLAFISLVSALGGDAKFSTVGHDVG